MADTAEKQLAESRRELRRKERKLKRLAGGGETRTLSQREEAEELAEARRELRRKERKLKRFDQALRARQHVFDTLRRHDVASQSESTLDSDSVNEIELKSSASRTVTFSAKSPEVIILSPLSSLVCKRKDGNRRYRSLSPRRARLPERIGTPEASQMEVLQRVTLPLKYSNTPEGINMRAAKAPTRNCNASLDSSTEDGLSDSVHDDTVVIVDDLHTSNSAEGGKMKVLGEEYGIISGQERRPPEADDRCESNGSEGQGVTRDPKAEPQVLGDSFINWPEGAEDLHIPEDTLSLPRERGTECDSDAMESQDIFASLFVTQCRVGPRKNAECKTMQNDSGISSSVARTNPPCENPSKVDEEMAQMNAVIDLGFERVMCDKIKEDVCESEIGVQSEDSFNSDVAILNVPDYSVEKCEGRHSLSAREGHGQVLTSSLVTSSLEGEESLYVLIVAERGFTLWGAINGRRGTQSGRQADVNGEPSSTQGRLRETWETVGDVSHLVGRASDIRDIVAVGLPSDEEARCLVAMTRASADDVQMLYVQFSAKDDWQVVESPLGLPACNVYKNLTACALGEWSVALCWVPDRRLVVADLDVTYSRRGKRWELQCRSSSRSPLCDGPSGTLLALHQPDPRGVVLYSSGDKLYIYDAVDDIVIHQFCWEMPAPTWALDNEDLMFLLSIDNSTRQICLSAVNPLNGSRETFFADTFRHCDGRTEESLEVQRAIRPTCTILVHKELIVTFSNGVVIHISTEPSTGDMPTLIGK